MSMNTDFSQDLHQADGDSDFSPLTAQQAEAWRLKHKAGLSVGQVLAVQFFAACLIVLVVWLVGYPPPVIQSVIYGALVVLFPSAVFARGIARLGSGGAVSGFKKLLVWEFVKLVLTIAFLLMAPKVVLGLSWLALVLAMIVTMKMYWVALLVLPSVKKLFN